MTRRLAVLARLATEAGARELAAEAGALAGRLGEGRFYVVCVGQFKRGKSTLLNALVGEPVLPTGVVPVTSVVTVVRHGPRLAACVRFKERDWEECEPRALSAYVSEEENPGNEKGVVAVEVFVPSALLESGMCLVDTPGLGSISPANSAAARAFVTHTDAALVVLGADPPISGEELALIAELAREVSDVVVVLNKADRVPDSERQEAIRFTARVLAEQPGRPVGPILEVSAAECLAGTGPSRDWAALVARLASLARDSGADLVRAAERRETAALVDRLLRELGEQEEALARPIEESRARVERLRAAVIWAEQALEELGHRLTGIQERLSRAFVEARDGFFGGALPEARRELVAAIRGEDATGPTLRKRAMERALEVTRRLLDRWREEMEPRAEALFREAMARFIELANGFQDSLAPMADLPGLPRLDPELGLRVRSRIRYTEMLAVAPGSAGARLLDVMGGRAWRRRAIERDAGRYLERLLEVNSARIKNDFEARVAESRRLLESEIRGRLRALSDSAERALESARQAHAEGAPAVGTRLERIRSLSSLVEALRD
ncbi:MAG TPA: dynamin family protein [Methylomirabilota bacterium]|nr:dynamin family protein [Methylomirabilota bacterium]